MTKAIASGPQLGQRSLDTWLAEFRASPHRVDKPVLLLAESTREARILYCRYRLRGCQEEEVVGRCLSWALPRGPGWNPTGPVKARHCC